VSFNLLHLEPRSGLSSGGGATVAPSRAGLTPFPPADPRALSPCSMRGNKKRPDLRGRPAGRVLRMHGDRGGVGAGDSGRRAGSAPAACAPRRREGGRGWPPAVLRVEGEGSKQGSWLLPPVLLEGGREGKSLLLPTGRLCSASQGGRSRVAACCGCAARPLLCLNREREG